jgi:pimeloyl-[acyl-carrier protein] methyl ester esterase
VFKGFRGIKPDLPGHGTNTEPYTSFVEMAKRIALSLPSRHDVVGWSLGGSVALMVALLFPSKVNRLFLIGTTPYFRGAWREANIRAFRLMIKREGVRAFRRMALGEAFEDRVETDSALRMLEDYLNLNLVNLLPLLRAETFIIHGSLDRVVPLKEAFRIKNLVKKGKLIILPGGHLPVRDEGDFIRKVFKVR